MRSPELDLRSREILRQTVRTFITFGEPVGSRTLSKVNPQGLSPATIRNIMADLEELGYLYQPHTSAGRVPTDKGYRFYVSTLMKGSALAPTDREEVSAVIRRTGGDVSTLVQQSSRLLSDMTDMVSFVTGPDFQQTVLSHVDFVRLGRRRVLVVLVSETGQVINRVIETVEDLDGEELKRCARYLEDEFQGLTLVQAREHLKARMREVRETYGQLIQNALVLGRAAFALDPLPSDLYLEGTSRMLGKPEFRSDIERARQLLAMLEEKNRLMQVLNACLEGEGLQIVIGSEARVPDLEGIALIGARYCFGTRGLGSIGIMGPTRMEYAKLISLVDYIARSLSEAISQAGDHTAN